MQSTLLFPSYHVWRKFRSMILPAGSYECLHRDKSNGRGGGLIRKCTFYKDRAPNYLITSSSFCRFTPSIKVVVSCYLQKGNVFEVNCTKSPKLGSRLNGENLSSARRRVTLLTERILRSVYMRNNVYPVARTNSARACSDCLAFTELTPRWASQSVYIEKSWPDQECHCTITKY